MPIKLVYGRLSMISIMWLSFPWLLCMFVYNLLSLIYGSTSNTRFKVCSIESCNSYAVLTVKAHLNSYPTPININMLWNVGYLISITLIIQIITGLLLASHYTSNIEYAYYSVLYIVRDVCDGSYLRYIHSTGASLIFILLYLHLMRAIILASYIYLPITWITGLILFLIYIVVGFQGYVLPWGQMSFWGATVICNILSPLPTLVSWILGSYNVSNPTLQRFFILHFILPLVSLLVIYLHIFYLHLQSSNNPLGYNTPVSIAFFPCVLSVDMRGIAIYLFVLYCQVFFQILVLSHPDNLTNVNIFITPLHIVPEWYYLPLYTILKVIPSKTIGVIILLYFIFVLFLFASYNSNIPLNINYLGNYQMLIIPSIVMLCGWSLLVIGAQLPSEIFISYGRIFIVLYFIFTFSLLTPIRASSSFASLALQSSAPAHVQSYVGISSILVEYLHNYTIGVLLAMNLTNLLLFVSLYITVFSYFFVLFLAFLYSFRDSYYLLSSCISSVLYSILISEFLLFASYFWAFYHLSLTTPTMFNSGILLPSCSGLIILIIVILSNASIITDVIYLSIYYSITYIYSILMMIIFILGSIFISCQITEFLLLQYFMSTSLYPAIFYSLTSLHFFHVLVGVFLISIYTFHVSTNYVETNMLAVPFYSATQVIPLLEYFIILYWHLVELLWLFIDFVLYSY